MVNSAESAQSSLYVEQALVKTTELGSGGRHEEAQDGGLPYPAYLGLLAVERLSFHSDNDAYLVAKGVKADFAASYEKMADSEAASAVRQRSMAWLDWLAQGTNLNVQSFDYLELATMAAEHGDAETVRQIIEEPWRLWCDEQASTGISDPTCGQLDRLSTTSIIGRIVAIARLMPVAPAESAQQVHAAIMPTFRDVAAEFTRRNLTDMADPIVRVANYLFAVETPDALEQIDILVAAMPMTAARIDVLVKLNEKNQRFAAALAEAEAWHDEKAGLARHHLAQYMRTARGTTRDSIDYPVTGSPSGDAAASQPIAAIIVDQIPDIGARTSAIETSVAYANRSVIDGSVHGNVLGCVRTLMDDPRFEFADPRFGFTATFKNGENGYTDGHVTVFDDYLPDGQIVVDLFGEPYRRDLRYDDTRFLCRIIQAEKNHQTLIS